MDWKKWATDTLIKTVKTMAQVALGFIGTGAIGIMEVDWANMASVSVMAGIACVLMNITNIQESSAPVAGKHVKEE